MAIEGRIQTRLITKEHDFVGFDLAKGIIGAGDVGRRGDASMCNYISLCR